MLWVFRKKNSFLTKKSPKKIWTNNFFRSFYLFSVSRESPRGVSKFFLHLHWYTPGEKIVKNKFNWREIIKKIMIRRFLATKPKFGSSTAPPTVPVKGFLLILAGFESRNSGKIRSDPFTAKTWAIWEQNGLIFVPKFSNFYFFRISRVQIIWRVAPMVTQQSRTVLGKNVKINDFMG